MYYFREIFKKFLISSSFKVFRTVAILFFTLFLLFGIYMKVVEGFTVVDTIYFLMTTATTVGYGDFSPKTDLGKIFSVFYQIMSISTIGVLIGSISELIVKTANKIKKGNIKMKKDVKLIIVNYPSKEKVQEIVSELRQDPRYDKCKIVVITNRIENKPEWFEDLNVEFKYGLGSDRKTLEEINIKSVETALVLARDANDISSDDTTSSAVAVIEQLSSDIRTIVEKVREDDTLFRASNANIIVRVTNPKVLAQEILDEGAIELLNSIFSNNNNGTQMNIVNEKEQSWKELAISLINNNHIAEGFKNPGQEKFNFSPKTEDIIEIGATIKYR